MGRNCADAKRAYNVLIGHHRFMYRAAVCLYSLSETHDDRLLCGVDKTPRRFQI
jgi:hypothetical protein